VPPLIAGQSEVNIVIRPGDVIRVPTAEAGLIYVTGEVARPGTYGLPPTSKLTVEQAIISAGSYTPTAIPQRVDLTRRLPGNRQATIRLNLAAIGQRTQPDVYLKADDTINVGTNFWAYPLAVFRNGLRISYGFGFVLDRNFSGDVFGENPEISN
jgi:polysaccharide export outer membrane protein